MPKKLNSIFIVIYYIFISLPVMYAVIGIYSYYSVLNTFGRVPGNGELYNLAKTKNLTIKTFPVKYGEIFLDIFFISLIVIPFYILINYLVHKYYSEVIFYKKHAITLLIVFMIAFIFFLQNPVLGWYVEYLLD